MKPTISTTIRLEALGLVLIAILALSWALGAWAEAVDGLCLK